MRSCSPSYIMCTRCDASFGPASFAAIGCSTWPENGQIGQDNALILTIQGRVCYKWALAITTNFPIRHIEKIFQSLSVTAQKIG